MARKKAEPEVAKRPELFPVRLYIKREEDPEKDNPDNHYFIADTDIDGFDDGDNVAIYARVDVGTAAVRKTFKKERA